MDKLPKPNSIHRPLTINYGRNAVTLHSRVSQPPLSGVTDVEGDRVTIKTLNKVG